jgi:hypothetical protein
MEYLDGTTLKHLLPGRPLDLERLIDVSIDVATGHESAARGSKAYSLGWKTQLTKAQRAGLPFHERAVGLDPNFAVAYSAMAWIYWSDGVSRGAQPKMRARPMTCGRK